MLLGNVTAEHLSGLHEAGQRSDFDAVMRQPLWKTYVFSVRSKPETVQVKTQTQTSGPMSQRALFFWQEPTKEGTVKVKVIPCLLWLFVQQERVHIKYTAASAAPIDHQLESERLKRKIATFSKRVS